MRGLKLLILFGGLTLFSCGGSSPAAPTTPTPPPFPYAGTWRGGGVAFTVAQSQITQFRLTILMVAATFSRGMLTISACNVDLELAGSVDIRADHTFVLNVQDEAGATQVHGTFSSSAAATGTYDTFQSVAAQKCGGVVLAGQEDGSNWTATKQ